MVPNAEKESDKNPPKRTFFVRHMQFQQQKRAGVESTPDQTQFVEFSKPENPVPAINKTQFVRHVRYRNVVQSVQHIGDPSIDGENLPPVPQEVLKSKIYRHFRCAEEYNTPWLDIMTQRILLDPKESPLIDNWTRVQVQYHTSVKDTVKNFFLLFFYFAIYATIVYFLYDRNSPYYNNTLNALFFPIFPYILGCFRNLQAYLKAAVFSSGSLYLYFLLLNKGIINYEGVIYLIYFVYLLDYTPLIQQYIPGFVNVQQYIPTIRTNGDLILFTAETLGVIFLVELFLLIIYWMVKKPDTVEFVLTNKAIYIRDLTKRSVWDMIRISLLIIIKPYNLKNYSDMRDRIRYNRMSLLEGKKYDFSKIPVKSVMELKKYTAGKPISMIIGIVVTIIGIAFLSRLYGLPIMILGILIFGMSLVKHQVFNVDMMLDRSKVEGSWILSHRFDILKLQQVPLSIAQFFQNIRFHFT